MAEPKAETDLSAPFRSVKAAVSTFGAKIPSRTLEAPPHLDTQHLAHVLSLQYFGHTYQELNHQAEKIFDLETELYCAHAEINSYKQQLAGSEADKNETQKLSDGAHWEEHLDAILGKQPSLGFKSRTAGGSANTTGHHLELVRLQKELENFKSQYLGSCKELSKAQQEIEKLQAQFRIVIGELSGSKLEIEKLQSELNLAHRDLPTELTVTREQIGQLRAELDVRGQRIGGPSKDQLKSAKGATTNLQEQLKALSHHHEDYASRLTSSREEIGRLQNELSSFQQLNENSSSGFGAASEVGNVGFCASAAVIDELTMELMATNEHLEKATAAWMKAEMELAFVKEDAEEVTGLRAELQRFHTELKVAKEAERRLEETTRETTELREQLDALKETEVKATKVTADLHKELISLNAGLCAARGSELEVSKLVEALRSEVEGLKAELAACKESERQTRELYESTRVELEKGILELRILREAEEMSSRIVASSSSELEALRGELRTTKEGEAQAKAAFADYSLKLQRMRIELEDAAKVAEKAWAFKLDLDEANTKLKEVMEAETIMSASMACLRAEVTIARAEIERVREEGEAALAEKEQDIEMDMTQMRAEWEAAVSVEAKLKENVTDLTNALAKLTGECGELKTFSVLVKEEVAAANQQLEQARLHNHTIESKLQAALLEVEVVKASEESALSQLVKFGSHDPDAYEAEAKKPGAKARIPREEYEDLRRKTCAVEELANTRVALAMAQVEAAKAGEKEMQSKLASAGKEIEGCRSELREAAKKREETEAAKSALEALLRCQRGDRRNQANNGYNVGSPMGSPSNGKDWLGFIRSPASGNSQSTSPMHPGVSYPTFSSPSSQDKRSRESLAEALATKLSTGEKQRKTRFSAKIGSYFVKKKDPPGSM